MGTTQWRIQEFYLGGAWYAFFHSPPIREFQGWGGKRAWTPKWPKVAYKLSQITENRLAK